MKDEFERYWKQRQHKKVKSDVKRKRVKEELRQYESYRQKRENSTGFER